jgi:hypothetical protein
MLRSPTTARRHRSDAVVTDQPVRRTARKHLSRVLAPHTLRVLAQRHVRRQHDVEARTWPICSCFRRVRARRQWRTGHCSTSAQRAEAARVHGEMAMNCKTWTIALVMAATTIGAANESLSMRVSPATSFAPANLVIRTRVEPDADNRAIEVIADGEDFLRSSMMQLEGNRAPKTTVFEFRSLPPGEYQVTASLIGADGKRRAMARTHVNVIESAASR